MDSVECDRADRALTETKKLIEACGNDESQLNQLLKETEREILKRTDFPDLTKNAFLKRLKLAEEGRIWELPWIRADLARWTPMEGGP